MQRRQARAVTLIEMLIVIAIISIMTDGVFRVYIGTVRVERGAARQREALEDLTVLERAWRGDVGAARAAKDAHGDHRAGPACIVLDMAGTAGVAGAIGRVHVYSAKPVGESPEVCVDRSIYEGDGRLVSRQRLASTLDAVAFGEETSGMLTLSVSTTRGFAPHNARQQYTAMAALGGAK